MSIHLWMRRDVRATVAIPVVAAAVRESRLVVRTQQRYAAVQERLAAGSSISQISRELDLERCTVYRFAPCREPRQVVGQDHHMPDPHRRLRALPATPVERELHSMTRLYDEIRAQGFSGGVQIVRRYLLRFRTTPAASAERPTQVKARQVTTWVMQEPAGLEADEQESLQRVLDRWPALNALAGHVRGFAEMMRDLRGNRLVQWIDGVQADDLPDLHSFVAATCSDQDAVVAALPMRWSSGPVDGQVNRLKILKRQMFGRANFDLLRRRVLGGNTTGARAR
jgi:Transposase